MDIDLTADQELFLETSRRFIDAACPMGVVRDQSGGGAGPGSRYTEQAAELGWFSMLVPESLGGGAISDHGISDGAVVAYTRGASLQPAPFVGVNVTALALSRAGRDEHRSKVLPALISGAESATWAFSSPGVEEAPTAGVVATRHGDSYRLTGNKTLVQDAGTASWILLSATTEQGPTQFLIPGDAPGVTAEPMDGLDLTRRFGQVVLDGAEVPAAAVVGEPGGAAGLVEDLIDVACVLGTAESVGAMDRDFEMALEYAKQRTAFGRPIGSFQAIKHLLADTSLLLETSKAMVTAAVRAVGEGAGDASAVASMAKAFVGDCGIELAANCFQVFGGIGFTWEHDQHLYMRRLTTDAALYGSPSWHRERVCRLGGL